jgi:hypothetical protein
MGTTGQSELIFEDAEEETQSFYAYALAVLCFE